MDAAAAQGALLACQRALAKALAKGEGEEKLSGLARFFANLTEERQRMADEVMAEAQESLGYMASPALVVEWMATRFYLLDKKR